MHTSISKKLLAGLLSVVMVLSLFAAVPANNAQAASLSLTGYTAVSAGVTNTYKILNMAKTQYAKVSVSNKNVTVKKGTAAVKSTTKIAGTGKAIALKANAKAAVAGKNYTLTVKVYNKKTNKIVKTLKKVIKVYNKTEAVALDQSTVTVDAGKTATLVATTTPAENTRPIKWTSSNEAVATVVDGVVTGVAEGTATITAKSGSASTAATVTVYGPLALKSVAAKDANTFVLTFNRPVEEIKADDIKLSNDVDAYDVTMSADKTSATVSVYPELVRGTEYTVNVKATAGEETTTLTGKFTWTVSDGYTLAYNKTTLAAIGAYADLSLKDADGKLIDTASYVCASSNTNVVTVNAGTGTVTAAGEGTATVTVKCTLNDGSWFVKEFDFTVAVKNNTISIAAVEGTESSVASYTALKALEGSSSDTISDNTLEAVSNVGYGYTGIFNPGNTYTVAAWGITNGDPDVDPIQWEANGKVRSSNPTVVNSVAIDANGLLTFTAAAVGTTTITAKDSNNKERSLTIKVVKPVEYKQISVKLYHNKLSFDKNVDIDTVGVDKTLLAITPLGTDGYTFAGGLPANYDVEISSNDAIATVDGNRTESVTGSALTTTIYPVIKATGTGKQTINVKVVNKATGKVVQSESVTLNVVAVDTTNDVPTSLDFSEVDLTVDADGINWPTKVAYGLMSNYKLDFDSKNIYVLNKAGNRIAKVSTVAGVTVSGETTLEKYFFASLGTSNDIELDAYAYKYLTKAGTLNVSVTANGITQKVAVAYKNSCAAPKTATLKTNSIKITLPSTGDVTFTTNGLLFGMVDELQMVGDYYANATPPADWFITVSANADAEGYLYNKPVFALTGAEYDLLQTYTTGTANDGDTWYAGQFYGQYAVANVSAPATSTPINSGVTVKDGDAVSYQIVVSALYADDYVTDSITYAGLTADEKLTVDAELNLIANPVIVTVFIQN